MGLIQIPGLGSLTGKESAWLDLISYSSSFLCHSAHLPVLFRVCSPVPLKSTAIFTAMKSSNVFSKAIGKSTWQNMHRYLLLEQKLWLGHCVLGRTQQAASLQPTGNSGGISRAGIWH